MRSQFVYNVAAGMAEVIETYKKREFFVASMKRAGARSVEIVEEEALPDGGHRWKAIITETSRLPQFLKASDILIIVNESAFYPSKKRLVFRIVPRVQTIRISLEGTITLRPSPRANETELTYDVDLSIGIPLLGWRTEKLGLKVVGDECRKQAVLLKEWTDRLEKNRDGL